MLSRVEHETITSEPGSRTTLNHGMFEFGPGNLSSAFATSLLRYRKFWTVKFSYSYFQESVQAGLHLCCLHATKSVFLATMPIF